MSLRPCLLRRSLTSTWGEFSLSAKRTGRPQADLTSAFGNLLPLFLSSPRRSVERYLPFIFNGGLGMAPRSVGLALASKYYFHLFLSKVSDFGFRISVHRQSHAPYQSSRQESEIPLLSILTFTITFTVV